MVLFLLLCSLPLLSSESVAVQDSPPLAPVASYRSAVSSCLVELRKVLPVTQSLDYFVGTGWDNLRNVHTRPVLQHTFDDCQTTPEGSYLIPDNVIALPVQKTEFDQMATFHESFTSYFKSITDTINVEASGSAYGNGWVGKASGSYSEKHQKTKMEMNTISSNLFITKLKAHSYSLLANPDAGLSPVFKSRLLEIADHLKKNLTMRAMYEAQLIVRDYGTHYVTRAEVGTTVEQLNYVNSDFNYKSQTHLDEMKATVSASFQSFYGGGSASISTGKVVTDAMKANLSTITRHVRVNTEGGPSAQRIAQCRADNNKTCIGSIDNLVALDHQGDPLYSLVSAHMFRELTPAEVYQLSDLLQAATQEYYKRNAITGCMDPHDTNFNFQANINDASCNGTEPEVPPFGGVYQMCESLCDTIEVFGFKFLACAPQYRCDPFVQRNTITGDFTCPVGYQPELITAYVYGGFEDRVEDRSKKYCYHQFAWTHCKGKTQRIVYKDKIRLRSFFCSPVSSNATDLGYFFGGLYAKGQPNLWTNTESCPPYYFPAKIAGEVNVCLTRDRELGGPYKVPLSWIFSCQTNEARKKCPEKYSAHLATITSTQCEVYYCIRSGVYKRFDLPHIKRPPFLSPSVRLSNVSTHYVRYFVNDTLVLSYPLEVVLEEAVKEAEENANVLAAPPSKDVNDLVANWIHKKLIECEGPLRNEGKYWPFGWVAFGMLGFTVAVVVAVVLVVIYRRRGRDQEQLLGNEM